VLQQIYFRSSSDSSCQDVSSTTLTHLLYSKFASVAAQVSPLLSEMERRASSYPAELLSLLAECHIAYLTARRTLLGPQITHEVKGMDPAQSELVELVSEVRPTLDLLLNRTSDQNGLWIPEECLCGRAFTL